jgi:SAM-dependent methyltransferase
MLIGDDDSCDLAAPVVADDSFVNDSEWAWRHYKPVIASFISQPGVRRVCEIGGGRNPLFSPDELRELGVEYTVLDVSGAELEMAGPEYRKLQCNIEDTDRAAEFDFMFSKMVLEHVGDAGVAYENIRDKLRPGGICLNFHPTLFALPFVVNRVFPETLTRRILGLAFPSRLSEESKFPARYSWCRASAGITDRLRALGFDAAVIVPFFGHGYYKGIPLLRSVEAVTRKVARRAGFKPVAAYAYTIVRR